MKKIILLTALAVLLGVATATAQQIAVVSEGGETTVYQTFQTAIEGASEGSVIYLPGGSFSLPDSVKITKRLTIIGIGHRSDNDNVDAKTWVAGNLWFNEGSSGSAVMACYITGNVNIGEGDASVNNVLVKFCNLNSVQVLNNTCTNTYINQNYIRDQSVFNESVAIISNNVMHSIKGVNSGQIYNNLFLGYGFVSSYASWHYDYSNIHANYSSIHNNVLTGYTYSPNSSYFHAIMGTDNTIFSNICPEDVGDATFIFSDVDWNVVFEEWNGGAIDPMSDFHFTEAYQQYHNIGIYGGSGFNDHQTAPVPYIVAKRIDQETDAAGQLKIQVRVKAGSGE